MSEAPFSDQTLHHAIEKLKRSIETWAVENDLWLDCGFRTYAEHVDGEPRDTPVVLIIYFGEQFSQMLDGYLGRLDEQFNHLLDAQGFWYERATAATIHIYPDDHNPMFGAFADLVRWQWICGLLRPDFADVHEEIYSHFESRPDDLQRLNWREFEILLFRIFQNQGFQAELGPGSGDGGADIRLLQRDPIGDILTLVQAKKYAGHRKISLDAVAALHGVADVEQAQRSIFVTTSAYLPSAKSFADRTSGRMILSTSADVAEWCKAATHGVIQDKSSLIAAEHVSRILQNLKPRDPRVVWASTGVTMILNAFALVLKESNHAALLMALPQKTVHDDGHGQVGTEVPVLGLKALKMLGPDNVFRAKRSTRDGRVTYWTGEHLYSGWDGEPVYFSWLD